MILDSRGSPLTTPVSGHSQLRLRYDAAQPNASEAEYWSWADGLSASAANSPDVRKRVRERARYEVANSAHCSGAVATLVNDVIGCGPRLSIQSDDDDTATLIEREWRRWWRATSMTEKLRTLRRSQCVDGESFALMGTNPGIGHAVKLSLTLIEAEQVSLPLTGLVDENGSDGVRYDQHSNVEAYHVLRRHPGDLLSWDQQGDWIEARHVLHFFRADRPGQTRGISELVASLLLYGRLRRYSDAVLRAAELAASLSIWLHTSQVPSGGMAFLDAGDSIPFTPGSIGTLPPGYSVEALRSEQPTTTYESYKQSLVSEAGRGIGLAHGKAAGDHSSYNYSSAKLESIEQQKSVDADRHSIEHHLDTIFDRWYSEAVAVGLVPDADIEPLWRWQGTEYADPSKESAAEATRLAARTTSLAAVYSRQGKDWETELRQIAKEKALLDELGLTEAPVSEAIEEEDNNE